MVQPPHPPREPTARLPEVINTYRPSKLFKPAKPESYVTSLDFDNQGELLVAACDDETLQLYSCRDGSHSKMLFSKKYGAHLARFTHQSSSVLYASTKVDDTIRYLSTHDNQYIRYFPGHTAAVTCLALSPGSDEFISCSLDNTVRIWALNTPNAVGKLVLHTPYLAAFDPSATVFAVASPGTSSVLMYDLRNYDKAPFATFDVLKAETTHNPRLMAPAARSGLSGASNPGRWTSVEFSNDGKLLLLGTASGNGHYLLDAFSGAVSAFCALKKPPSSLTESTAGPDKSLRLAPGNLPLASGNAVRGQGNVCFTPDARYVVGGAGDQNMFVWDTHQAPARSDSPPASADPAQANSSSAATNPNPGESGAGEGDGDGGKDDSNNNNNNNNNNSGSGEGSPSSTAILYPQHELESKNTAAVVAFNPRFNHVVSADQDVVFWVPNRSA